MKKIIAAILLMALISIVIGCIEDETPIELNLKIGETAKTSKLEVTIISAEMERHYIYYYDFGGGNQRIASPENIYVIVEADIKNIGSDSTFVGSGDFSVTDSEGYKYDPESISGKDVLETRKELYSNQKVKGQILFEVPKSANDLKIQYNFGTAFTGTKLASWNVE